MSITLKSSTGSPRFTQTHHHTTADVGEARCVLASAACERNAHAMSSYRTQAGKHAHRVPCTSVHHGQLHVRGRHSIRRMRAHRGTLGRERAKAFEQRGMPRLNFAQVALFLTFLLRFGCEVEQLVCQRV